ncbi:MAG: GNAT family N-acetyltransferase [Rubrobacteraceae bacterium]
MEVREVSSEEEVRKTYPVMRQLRSHLAEDEYVSAVERMRGEGYRLAAAFDDGTILGVAGFRVQEFLYCGKILYVDDLVTAKEARSTGVGAAMMRWLEDEAKRNGCEQLHLDSGVQRKEAHRFYFREGMGIFSFHFVKELR